MNIRQSPIAKAAYVSTALLCVTAVSLGGGCSSSKKSGSGGGSYREFDCYVLGGSTLSLTGAGGATAARMPFGCQYFTDSGGGVFMGMGAANANAIGQPGALWLYIQPAMPNGNVVVADSAIVPLLGAGVDLTQVNASLEGLGIPSGSIMASINSALGTNVVWYDTSGGAATIAADGPWPVSAPDSAGITIHFEAATMKVRTCAAYPNGGACGTAPVLTGTPALTGTMTGTIKLRVGATVQKEECLPVAGNGGCVDFDQSCDAAGGRSGKCTGTVCTYPTNGSPGVCCIPDDVACGSAGTGTECCSGQCSSEGVCGPKPDTSACTSSTGGGLECISFPRDSVDAQGNHAWVGADCQCASPANLPALTNGFSSELLALVTHVSQCAASDCCISVAPTAADAYIACQCEDAAARQGVASVYGTAVQSCAQIASASAGMIVPSCPGGAGGGSSGSSSGASSSSGSSSGGSSGSSSGGACIPSGSACDPNNDTCCTVCGINAANICG